MTIFRASFTCDTLHQPRFGHFKPMIMPCQPTEVEVQLQQLETVLRQLNRWSGLAPSRQAFSSRAPFCCDTMLFEQWLQFVFIPQMRDFLQRQKELPHAMQLAVMGHHCFDDDGSRTTIIPVLEALDALFRG